MEQDRIIELIVAGYRMGFVAAYKGHAQLATLTEEEFDELLPKILNNFRDFAKKAAADSILEIQIERLVKIFREAK